jgi:hypothetical protein
VAFAAHARTCQKEGIISQEQAAAIVGRIAPPPAGDGESAAEALAKREDAGFLFGVFNTWSQFGYPMAGGGMAGLIDTRASLYPGRVAWLNENQVEGGERLFVQAAWEELDRVYVRDCIDRSSKAGGR